MFRFMTKERGADAVEEEGGSVGWAMRGPPAPLRQGRACVTLAVEAQSLSNA